MIVMFRIMIERSGEEPKKHGPCTMDHDQDRLGSWAQKKGAKPPDYLLPT